MKPAKHLTHIEPLEARIAPALILSPYAVTFQDIDGDTAIVKISKPLFTSPTAAGNILIFTNSSGAQIQESFTGNGTAESLAEINLLGRTDATGMNISVTVIPQVGVGNLQVNVGDIAAANFSVNDHVSQNIDLGTIYIQGNLGQIDAGASAYLFTPAIKSLTAYSMNPVISLDSSQANVASEVLGPIDSLNVKGDFTTNLFVVGYQFGSIGTLNIGGSLTGDSFGDAAAGVINFTGHIGTAKINSITGTSANDTAQLIGVSSSNTGIGSLVVTNSVTGGSGTASAEVFAEDYINKVSVGGDLTGGAGASSGQIAGPMGVVTIGGSIVGGSGTQSGTLLGETINTLQHAVAVGIGSIKVTGDVVGGSAGTAASGSGSSAVAASPGDSGVIFAGSVNHITIGGSLIGGSSAGADVSGALLVDDVGSLSIVGNIVGGSAELSGVIAGTGQSSFMEYNSITVNGSITGGAGAISGAIELDTGLGFLSNLHLAGSLTGGTGTQSGEVYVSTQLTKLYVGGDVVGGPANNTGDIIVNGGSLGSAMIKGSLIGNTMPTSAAMVATTAMTGTTGSVGLSDSGYIQAAHIGTLEIKGNVTAGTNTFSGMTGPVANSGAIRSSVDILSLTIDGTVTGTAGNPVIISAQQGPASTGKVKTDLAISSLTFEKAVSYLDILAGYSPTVSTTNTVTTGSGASAVSTTTNNAAGAPLGTPVDATAQIGTVTFMGDLSATNVAAGVIGVTGATGPANGVFGTAGDTAIPMQGTSSIHSIIGRIILEGTVAGDSTAGDHFGFVAQEVQTVTLTQNNTTITLEPGPNNDHLVPVAGNLVVNEVPPVS